MHALHTYIHTRIRTEVSFIHSRLSRPGGGATRRSGYDKRTSLSWVAKKCRVRSTKFGNNHTLSCTTVINFPEAKTSPELIALHCPNRSPRIFFLLGTSATSGTPRRRAYATAEARRAGGPRSPVSLFIGPVSSMQINSKSVDVWCASDSKSTSYPPGLPPAQARTIYILYVNVCIDIHTCMYSHTHII